MMEIQAKVPPEERTPYVIVAFQECERMNMLVSEMRRSLKELDLGLKVRIFCLSGGLAEFQVRQVYLLCRVS